MNILIVYCHPSPTSYTKQVLQNLKHEFLQRNCAVEVSDLYAMNFQSDMTAQEYEREGFSRTDLPVANDVAAEHKKINRADGIIFLYPIWWSDCPAKLKGWFDRVWSVGFAYKKSNPSAGMRTVKYGVALCTAGYTEKYLHEIQIAQSMKKVMLDDRFGNRFENKRMIILGGTLDISSVKEQHQRLIQELVSQITPV